MVILMGYWPLRIQDGLWHWTQWMSRQAGSLWVSSKCSWINSVPRIMQQMRKKMAMLKGRHKQPGTSLHQVWFMNVHHCCAQIVQAVSYNSASKWHLDHNLSFLAVVCLYPSPSLYPAMIGLTRRYMTRKVRRPSFLRIHKSDKLSASVIVMPTQTPKLPVYPRSHFHCMHTLVPYRGSASCTGLTCGQYKDLWPILDVYCTVCTPGFTVNVILSWWNSV